MMNELEKQRNGCVRSDALPVKWT